MDFERLLEIVGNEPVFESALLMAGDVKPNQVRQQLARWTKNERLYQLRRGLYALAPPFQKVRPHPFLVANRLRRASYVSLESALAFYGLIPETVQATTSITTRRPERLETPLGVFEYQHVRPELLRGYRLTDLDGQQALAAAPEKALLDLVYLQPGGDSESYLEGLRLQNLDRLDPDRLASCSAVFNTPKIDRAAAAISQLAQRESQEYETL